MGALGSADYCGGPDHFALASHKMMSVRVRSDEPTNPVCTRVFVCVCVVRTLPNVLVPLLYLSRRTMRAATTYHW